MQLFNSPFKIASLALVGMGVGLLGLSLVPGGNLNVALPLVFLMLGGALFILALAGRPRLRWAALAFIPGALLMTLGLVFLLNVLTNDSKAWAYAWLIVVAGVGAGMVLASQGQGWPVVSLVGWCLAGGGVTLSVIFGAIAGGLFIQVMAPVLLILGGLSLRWLPWEKILPDQLYQRLHRAPLKAAVAPPADAAIRSAAEARPSVAVPGAPPVSAGLVEPLSPRELEVLRLVEEGLTNQQIADKLSVAPSTVKTHINNIYGKMAVESRMQAVNRARELRLL
jgi:DNA-binding CsgD family transcriptional regulator